MPSRDPQFRSPGRSARTAATPPAWTLATVVLLAILPGIARPDPGPAVDTSGWMHEFGAPEPDGTICAFEEYQGALIIAGAFTLLEGNPLWHIARWDGGHFRPLGDGLNGPVRALATYRGDLIAAGDFTAAGTMPLSRIARWDGTSWQPLGTGSDIPILTIAVLGDTLFAGGPFGAEFGPPTRAVRAWDGVQWRDAGFEESVPVSEGYVRQLLAFDGRLVGWWDNQRLHPNWDDVPSGVFHLAGERIAGRWRQMPEEYPGEWYLDHFQPDALLVQDARLYAVGGLGYGHLLVEWDGRSWRQLAPPGPYTTAALGTWRGQLLAATDDRLQRWTGTSLEPLTPLDLRPSLLHAWRDELWMAGRHALAPDASQPALFRWDGTTWTHFGRREGSGIRGEDEPYVASLALSGNSPAIFGRFDRAGSGRHIDLAVRRGHGWRSTPLEGGLRATPGSAQSLWSHGPWLYFATYGNFAGRGLLRSSSDRVETVTALGAIPLAIHNWNGRLFLGNQSGQSGRTYIIEREAGDWRSPGWGLNGPVEALCTHRGELVAGGSFTSDMHGTATLRSVACWDGYLWREFGGGLPDPVTALTPFRGGLAAACTLPVDPLDPGFDPTRPARGAVFWFDGTAWQQFGSLFNGRLRDLEVFHGRLVAAGDFTLSPGRGGIAAFEDGNWIAMDEGLNGPAHALLAHDDTLWVGGRFTAAGTAISARFAGWVEPTVPLEDFRLELASPPRAGSKAAAADSIPPPLPPDAPRVRVSFRLPDDPRFDRAVLRLGSTGFPADPADGDPLRPGTDGSFDGEPGEEIVYSRAVAEGSTLYVCGFAIDVDGQVSRPVQSILPVPDRTPPVFWTEVRRLRPEAPGTIRFGIELHCDEPDPSPAPRARFGSEESILERRTGPPGFWIAEVSRPTAAESESIRISLADSVRNTTVATGRWVLAPVFPQKAGRCAVDEATWVEFPVDAVRDPSWLVIVKQPEAGAPTAASLGAWQIALNESPRRPLLFVDRPASRTAQPIDLDRLVLTGPGGDRLPGTYDPETGQIWFWIERNGLYWLTSADQPASTRADPRALTVDGPFPNPARRAFEIRWELDARQAVRFELFDVTGRRVATPFDGLAGPGAEIFRWSPSPDLPPGVYFGQVRTGTAERTVRLVWRP